MRNSYRIFYGIIYSLGLFCYAFMLGNYNDIIMQTSKDLFNHYLTIALVVTLISLIMFIISSRNHEKRKILNGADLTPLNKLKEEGIKDIRKTE